MDKAVYKLACDSIYDRYIYSYMGSHKPKNIPGSHIAGIFHIQLGFNLLITYQTGSNVGGISRSPISGNPMGYPGCPILNPPHHSGIPVTMN